MTKLPKIGFGKTLVIVILSLVAVIALLLLLLYLFKNLTLISWTLFILGILLLIRGFCLAKSETAGQKVVFIRCLQWLGIWLLLAGFYYIGHLYLITAIVIGPM